jgi:hypothetical protein
MLYNGEFDKLKIAESATTQYTFDQKANVQGDHEAEYMQVDSARPELTSRLVASAYDWAESAKIEQILRDDFHQFESVADKNKKK